MEALLESCLKRCDRPQRGDLDARSGTNQRDLAILGRAWLSKPGKPHWNPACDISIPYDDSVDTRDLMVLVQNWLGDAQ